MVASVAGCPLRGRGTLFGSHGKSIKVTSGNDGGQSRRLRYSLDDESSDLRYFLIFCGDRLSHGTGRKNHVCQCRFCLGPRARFQTAIRVGP
ncbi:hypothetical protein SBC1_48700 (plasmid) [Caballeronia sp. SBC1]|nr:hypothetical protein SBC2_39270 [Caballeronia sp. SBC2]QIN64830.1 hypothetical protein SBC1_48700 [Caballeronia sp. SBC1]